jgi:Uma2 family endonuclease
MSTAVVRTPLPGQSLLLSDVDWNTYSRFLYLFAERPGYRLTYDRGELEIMAPLLNHDDEARFLGDIVFVVTEELELPLHRGGSVTVRRRRDERGIEADECFWIAMAHRMKGRKRLDLRRDPPPDLAIEVDVTKSCMNQLSIYAKLRVPEIWRLTEEALTFHVLNTKGHYELAKTSKAISLLTPAIVMEFLVLAREAGDQNTVTRQLRKWVRQAKKA